MKKGLKPPDNLQTKRECIFKCQEHGFSISKEYLAKNIYLRDDREEINLNNQEVGRKVSSKIGSSTKWTVLGRSGRSKGVKVDCPKVGKWTVQKG